LKLLEKRKDHPSAEQIFLELKPAYPTLSIATVYSTAQLLARGSMLRILSIDEKMVYYDPDMDPHAHFLCRSCKRLFDVRVTCDVMRSFTPADGISSVEMAEVYYYGRCRHCSRAA
jgi:Fur family peroxide stress response transcriptional regulator